MRSYAYHASLRVSQMPCRDLHLFALCGKKHSVHLFMVLSCNSQMSASGGLYFFFIFFFSPPMFEHFPNVQMFKLTLLFLDTAPISLAIWRNRSGEWTSQEGVVANFSRSWHGAKLFLRCDSSGFQSERALILPFSAYCLKSYNVATAWRHNTEGKSVY